MIKFIENEIIQQDYNPTVHASKPTDHCELLFNYEISHTEAIFSSQAEFHEKCQLLDAEILQEIKDIS